MDFETTILTRFDMMFLVKAIPFSLQHAVRLFSFVAPTHWHPALQDIRDEEKDYTLAMHLIGLHNEGKQEDPDVTSFMFSDSCVYSAEGEQGTLLRARLEEVRRRVAQRLRLLRTRLVSGT